MTKRIELVPHFNGRKHVVQILVDGQLLCNAKGSVRSFANRSAARAIADKIVLPVRA